MAWLEPAHANISGLVKWSELPRMDAYGYDFASQQGLQWSVADDWLCVDGLPVTDIHWWGSYWIAPGNYPNSNGFPDPTNPNVKPDFLQSFLIRVYTDVPSGTDPNMPWSHPATLLGQIEPDAAATNETYYGTVTHLGGITENVWQYNLDLPQPLIQELGKIYWLNIEAVLKPGANVQWGWHEADTLILDNSVQWGMYGQQRWELLPDKDMAFELTTIPEPSTALLLACGILGLLGVVRQRF
jgi:hypothetical protein